MLQSATDAINTPSKTAIQKTAKATGDLIGNKIADKYLQISRGFHHRIIQRQLQMNQKNIEHDKKIPRERYISPEQRHKVIDDLRLI